MTVRWGRCSNFKNCKDAKRRQHIPIPQGAAFVCPECSQPLLDENDIAPQEAPVAPGKKPSATFMVGVTVALLLVVVGGFATWGRLHSADAAVAKNMPNAILRLAGSNTIGDSLGPSLAEAFLKDQGATDVRILPGANPLEKIVEGVLPGDRKASSITIAAHGSATAFTALAENSCDIGMASRKVKPDEAAKLTSLGIMSSVANEHILGLDGIAVIVNAANPADQLDKEKIMRIFTGEITDWSQVGSLNGAIKIYARNDNSGTYDTFKSLVLAGKPLAASAQRIEDSKALSDAVAADPYGIGFIALPYIQSAKPIAVSDKGTLALLPTRLTVGTEDYLLSRRLYLYTPANPANKYTRQFLEFAISSKTSFKIGYSYHYTFSNNLDGTTSVGKGDKKNDAFSYSYIQFSLDLFSKTTEEKQLQFLDLGKSGIYDFWDMDGDYVMDLYDQCPWTPTGEKVDSVGCPLDDDKDGVPNYRDKEKQTPPNAFYVDVDGREVKEGKLLARLNNNKSIEQAELYRHYPNLLEGTGLYRRFYMQIPPKFKPLDLNNDEYISLDELLKTIDSFLESKSDLKVDDLYELVEFFFIQ